MKIRLDHPLRPFSHTSGAFVILPGTFFSFQIFPALIKVWEATSANPKLIAEITLGIDGPVKDFTVQLDLEKRLIKIWGFSPDRYWRYTLTRHPKGFELKFEKEKIALTLNSNDLCNLIHQESSLIFETKQPAILDDDCAEKLFLGVNKAQCWEQIQARKNLAEIFPFWLRLGQLLPKISSDDLGEGTTSFLVKLKNKDRESYNLTHFENLFQTGFSNLLSPRLEDEQFQGFDLPALKNDQLSSLILLQEGANLIKSLFFDDSEEIVKILPFLPPQFHCGKYINIKCERGIFHLEWTKKTLRRMIFESCFDQTFRFKFSSDIKSFRWKKDAHEKGGRVSSTEVLSFVKNKLYFFDCFQK